MIFFEGFSKSHITFYDENKFIFFYYKYCAKRNRNENISDSPMQIATSASLKLVKKMNENLYFRSVVNRNFGYTFNNIQKLTVFFEKMPKSAIFGTTIANDIITKLVYSYTLSNKSRVHEVTFLHVKYRGCALPFISLITFIPTPPSTTITTT